MKVKSNKIVKQVLIGGAFEFLRGDMGWLSVLCLSILAVNVKCWPCAAKKLIPRQSLIDFRAGSSVSIFNRNSILGSPGAWVNLVSLTTPRTIKRSGKLLYFEYVDGGIWPETEITAPIPSEDAFFGSAVDVAILPTGIPRLVAGASGERAAYIFHREAAQQWTHMQRIAPYFEGHPRDGLGMNIAQYGNWIALGAGNHSGTEGRVYMFLEGDQGIWSGEGHLVGGPSFGTSVAMHSSWLAVGAPSLCSVSLFQIDPAAVDPKDSWVLRQTVQQPVGCDAMFGRSVALSNNTLAVGADNTVFLYSRIANGWNYSTSVIGRGGEFGHAVSLSATNLLVGAPSATGVFAGSGGAYLFTRDDRSPQIAYRLLTRLWGVESFIGDRFGSAVDLDFDGVGCLVGAPHDEIQGEKSGSAYFTYYWPTCIRRQGAGIIIGLILVGLLFLALNVFIYNCILAYRAFKAGLEYDEQHRAERQAMLGTSEPPYDDSFYTASVHTTTRSATARQARQPRMRPVDEPNVQHVTLAAPPPYSSYESEEKASDGRADPPGYHETSGVSVSYVSDEDVAQRFGPAGLTPPPSLGAPPEPLLPESKNEALKPLQPEAVIVTDGQPLSPRPIPHQATLAMLPAGASIPGNRMEGLPKSKEDEAKGKEEGKGKEEELEEEDDDESITAELPPPDFLNKSFDNPGIEPPATPIEWRDDV